MKKKIILLCILIAALALEALPNGVVIYFANPEGDPFRETYSYFSLIPYGYADIFPFITAVMTCILLLIIIMAVIFKKELGKKTAIFAGIASALSLCPILLLGIADFTIIAAAISVCLIAVTVVASFKGVKGIQNRKQ